MSMLINMMFFIVFAFIVSILLAASTCFIIRSKQSSKPLACQSANLASNSSKSSDRRIDNQQTQTCVLFIAGLSGITNRVKSRAEAILTAFIVDTFGLSNIEVRVLHCRPGSSLRSGVVVAQVDKSTYHHVLLLKHIFLRESSVTIDTLRSTEELRRRYSARLRARASHKDLPSPNPTGVATAGATARIIEGTIQIQQTSKKIPRDQRKMCGSHQLASNHVHVLRPRPGLGPTAWHERSRRANCQRMKWSQRYGRWTWSIPPITELLSGTL